jgi:hypothetical protein
MTLKWIAFLFCALALGGCCASGSGCYAPAATASPVAWDGLGPTQELGSLPEEETGVVADAASVGAERTRKPAKKVVVARGGSAPVSDVQPHSNEWWARKEAEDRNADKALTRKLIICQGCSSNPPGTDERATGSVPH